MSSAAASLLHFPRSLSLLNKDPTPRDSCGPVSLSTLSCHCLTFPAIMPEVLRFFRRPGLSPGRLRDKLSLIQRSFPSLVHIDSEYCFNVGISGNDTETRQPLALLSVSLATRE